MVEPAAGGDAEDIKCDVVLVSIGRIPFTEGLGLEHVGVEMDQRGVIQVDEHFKTSVDGIYAIGDVIPGTMLAHKAEEEGIACVEHLAGQATHINYDAIPSVVYTSPEALRRQDGRTAQRGRRRLQQGSFPFGEFPGAGQWRYRWLREDPGRRGNRRSARRSDHRPGRRHADRGTGAGHEFGASSEDIARTCHAHPTLNEAVKEATLGVEGLPIHI